MEEWLWITLGVLFGALVILLQKYIQQWKEERANWPPGPRRLPIIGNLHQLSIGGDLVHVKMAKLAQEHGGLMTIWFGCWEPTIVISDYELVWEALVNKGSDFSSRSLPKHSSKFATADWNTIATSDLGSHWDKLRRGLHSSGLSPSTILEQIPLQEEDMSNLFSTLEEEASSNNGVVKPLQHIRRTTIQLIGRLCFGPQFKGDDVFVDGIDCAVDEFLRLESANVADLFDFAMHIPGLNHVFKQGYKLKYTINKLLGPYIESLKFSSPTQCYLHFLLSQNLSTEIVIACLFELFVFAVDSTSTTIAWALAFLIHHQDAQKKLHDEVSGRHIIIEVDKVRELKYLHAVVKETMRMRPIAPLAVPHRAARDSTLMGTKILEGTPIMVNLYALLHNPNIWVEAHRFIPERFMASFGPGTDVDKSYLPFGVGRRSCPGMEVGKLQVAFALASLVNKFHWSTVTEGQPPDLAESFSLILSMKTALVARITPHSS